MKNAVKREVTPSTGRYSARVFDMLRTESSVGADDPQRSLHSLDNRREVLIAAARDYRGEVDDRNSSKRQKAGRSIYGLHLIKRIASTRKSVQERPLYAPAKPDSNIKIGRSDGRGGVIYDPDLTESLIYGNKSPSYTGPVSFKTLDGVEVHLRPPLEPLLPTPEPQTITQLDVAHLWVQIIGPQPNRALESLVPMPKLIPERVDPAKLWVDNIGPLTHQLKLF